MKIPEGRYKHFKGKEYQVLGMCLHSETKEQMVIYQALYGNQLVWVRPAKMWNEVVKTDTYKGPRFVPVSDVESDGLPFPQSITELSDEEIATSLIECDSSNCDQCPCRPWYDCESQLLREAAKRLRKKASVDDGCDNIG